MSPERLSRALVVCAWIVTTLIWIEAALQMGCLSHLR